MNRMLENFLRCYCSHQQNDWDELILAAEVAFNSAHIESLGMTPFELDLGWQPKSPLDCLAGPESMVESVNELRGRLDVAYQDAKFAQLAKACTAAYNSQKYTPITYKVGDVVWLSHKYFSDAVSKVQTSSKLGVKR